METNEQTAGKGAEPDVACSAELGRGGEGTRSAAPTIAGARVQWAQDGDADSAGDFQLLSIEAVDAGGGFFYVLRTERWAVDRPEELLPLLERVRALVEPEPTEDFAAQLMLTPRVCPHCDFVGTLAGPYHDCKGGTGTMTKRPNIPKLRRKGLQRNPQSSSAPSAQTRA